MFSLTKGKPVAKTDTASRNRLILSIFDPDLESDRKRMSCRKSKSLKIQYKGCGNHNRKPCCRHCDDGCYNEPCCDRCHLFFDDLSESESVSSESYSEEDYDKPTKTFISPRDSKLVPLPDLTDRFVDYIAGPSGSGKSTIASGLATEFKKIFPRKPIYIFSRTDAKNDPAFAKLKPIQISIDDSLLTEPIDITQEIREGGALMIFDDCGTIQNDKLRKEVEKLMADAMEVGRKLQCSMIITNHLVIPNEKKFARTVLNEMHNLTVFPKSGSAQQIRYALKTYFGLNNKQIDEILALKSRWVRISKSYPQYVLYDKGAYIL